MVVKIKCHALRGLEISSFILNCTQFTFACVFVQLTREQQVNERKVHFGGEKLQNKIIQIIQLAKNKQEKVIDNIGT